MNGWTGPRFPNRTSQNVVWGTANCSTGCVFDVTADPTEHRDLARSQPALLALLTRKLVEAEASVWNPSRGRPAEQACRIMADAYYGHYGPFERLS